jgi:hypothetical protein
VTEQTEARAVGGPRKAGDQVGAAGQRLDKLAVEAGMLELSAQEFLRGQLVARRIDRVQLDEPLEQCYGFLSEAQSFAQTVFVSR